MAEAAEPTPGPVGSRVWPVAALGLVAAGWLVFVAMQGYADRLREQWGPAPDVVDALGRDVYVGRHTLPYLTLAVALNGGAALALLARSRRGWPRAIKMLAGVMLLTRA